MANNDLNSNRISQAREILLQLLTESTEELFTNYNLKVAFVESFAGSENECKDITIVGLLGATADGLRSTVAIQTNFRVLHLTYPAKLENMAEEHLQDWIGELCNQLIGFLKIKLANYGCELTLGVPTVIIGNNLKTVLPKRSESTTLCFSTEIGESIYILISTLLDEDTFNLDYNPNSSSSRSSTEGDFIFF